MFSEDDVFFEGDEDLGTFKPVCEKCGAQARPDGKDGPVMWLTCTACGHRWFLTPDDIIVRLLREN